MSEPEVASDQPSLPPATTRQQDITLAGQRRINVIWEFTQATIAIGVVGTNMVVATVQALYGQSDAVHPTVLSSVLFLVIGFYFARTNHSQIGGIGTKATDHETYRGR